MHPVVPFVTTALWDRLPWFEGQERPEDLCIADWPSGLEALRDDDAASRIDAFQELVTAVRQLRKEYGVGEGAPVTLHLDTANEGFRTAVDGLRPQLARMARVEHVEWGAAPDGSIGAASVLPSGAEAFLPLEGLVDLDRERERVRDEIDRIRGLRAGTMKKLDNEQFVTRAPADVVQKERDKLATADDQIARLEERLARLEGGA